MHTWDWDFSYHVQKQWKYLLLECILNVFSFVILSYISINSNVYQVQQQQLYWQNRRHFKVSFCPLTALRSKKKKRKKERKNSPLPSQRPWQEHAAESRMWNQTDFICGVWSESCRCAHQSCRGYCKRSRTKPEALQKVLQQPETTY